MNEPMSDSYKKAVEEFPKWSDTSSARINDSKFGVSPKPRFETPFNHLYHDRGQWHRLNCRSGKALLTPGISVLFGRHLFSQMLLVNESFNHL